MIFAIALAFLAAAVFALVCGATIFWEELWRYFTSNSGTGRALLKHERRMAELNAVNESKRLELERMRLDIEYLEANGVRASVPGLEQAVMG